MPYSKEDLKATFSAEKSIWEALSHLAKQKGFKDTRSFINSEIRRIGKLHEQLPVCNGKREKRQNTYRIPKFLEKNFQRLSCQINMPISTIITCYLVVQALEGESKEPSPHADF
jgi:hypothetical protein